MKRETEKIKEMLKQPKGITLIALVVTIVVLIILAVVSINTVFGENGLISSAEKAEVEHTHATVWERMEIEYSNYWTGKVAGEKTDLISYLKGKEIIGTGQTSNGGYKINTVALTGARLALGNGEGDTDVYKLEEVTPETGSITKVATTEETIKLAETDESKTYRVMYYGEDASKNRELGILVDGIENVIENDNSNFEITKEVTSPPDNGQYYVEDEEIEWTITVKNTGKVTMKNIHIPDTLTAGSGTYVPGDEEIKVSSMSKGVSYKNGEFIIDSLEPNGTATIEYTYTVTQGDVEANEVIINKIGEITGTPKPVIPKGEKLPEVVVPKSFIVDDPEDYEYDATEHKWEPVVKDSKTGKILQEDRDYIIDYNTNDFINTNERIEVTITGIGDYGGEETRLYAIKPADIVIIADNFTKIQGNPDPIFTAKIYGLKGNDQLTLSDMGIKIARDLGETPGTYSITFSAPYLEDNHGQFGNYNITCETGTLTIIPPGA